MNLDGNNSMNNNLSTGINNIDNSMKENKSKAITNLIMNEYNNKNNNKSLELTNQKNSKIFKGFIFPMINQNYGNSFQKNIKKILVSLIIILILSKSLIFLSLYMLLFKVNEIKILSFIDENNYELIFTKYSAFSKLNSIEEEYIFLFMCYFLLNIFQYFFNLKITSIALKKRIINFIFYYLSFIILLISSLIFIYFYSYKFTNTKISSNKIRKAIIICFVFNFIINECIMIMSVFLNIIGKKKGFSEKLLKDIKTSSLFFAALFFTIIQSVIIFIHRKYNRKYKYI